MAPGHALCSNHMTSQSDVASEKPPSISTGQRSKQRGPANHPGIGVRLRPSPGNLPKPQKLRQPQTHARPRAHVLIKPAVQPHRKHKQAGNSHVHPNLSIAKPQTRSNRLGQRARRALSERLYGTDAKHVTTEGGQRVAANAVHELRARTSTKDHHVQHTGHDVANTQGAQISKVRGQNHERPVSAVERPLGNPPTSLRGVVDESHPSWVAKRRQKELSRMKPCGRRTVFKDEEGEDVARVSPALQVPDTPLSAENHGTQCGIKSPIGSCVVAGVLGSDRKRSREKSWGDAGRETLSGFAPDWPKAGPCGNVESRSPVGHAMKLDSRDDRREQPDGKLSHLHPSWAAAKQRKVELAKLQAMAMAYPTGNKIKFDD